MNQPIAKHTVTGRPHFTVEWLFLFRIPNVQGYSLEQENTVSD
jgi:hypothetical protein